MQKALLSAADCVHPSQGMEEIDLDYQTINLEAKNSKGRFSCEQLGLSSFTQNFCHCALRVALLKKPCEKFLCSLSCARWFWEERRWWLLSSGHAKKTLAMYGWKSTCLSWHVPLPSPRVLRHIPVPPRAVQSWGVAGSVQGMGQQCNSLISSSLLSKIS